MINIEELKKEVEIATKKIFGEKLEKVFLFGSYARGDYGEDSDIDFAAIVNVPIFEMSSYNNLIGDIVGELTLKYGIIITLIVINTEYFVRYKDILPFYSNILNEGQIIYES